MRLSALLSLCFASATVSAYLNLNPDPNSLATRAPRCSTNADCIRQKLPLLAPRRRSRTIHARDPMASAAPITGTIHLFDSEGTFQGYVGATRNTFGEYGLSTTDPLVISLESRTETGPQNALTSKAIYGWSHIAGITGFASLSDNLGPGSFNYAYLGASDSSTSPGSPPQSFDNSFTAATAVVKKIETAIFTYSSATSNIVPQWINDDGSAPATYLLLYRSDNVLVLTGDVAAFEAVLGNNFVLVTAKFVTA